MLAPVHHILALTTIDRERTLPINGNVLVKLNQKVASTDPVAEATWAREHILIDVARKFRISPSAADQLMLVKEGDEVLQDVEVAAEKGLIPRTLYAPRNGRVVAAGSGQILMETGETTVKVKAGLSGTVVEVIQNRGAIIRAVGVLVQGVWGNGRIDTGNLFNLMEKPDDVLVPERLDISMRGSVILAGHVRDSETLQAAANVPVSGLILSSISPSLFSVARQMRYPIVAVDGIGHVPMNSVAYKLLTSNSKREATLNAESLSNYTGTRPEIIIPLPVSQEPPPPEDIMELSPGQTIRVRRAPHAGATGTLTKIIPGLTTLPSGLRAQAANIKLDNGEQIIIPLANLEIVG